MITKIYRGAALIFGLALAATPALSQAATAYSGSQPVHVNYDTSLQSMFGFDYPYTGTLQLTFNPDGIINGYYRPADNMQFIPVNGGRSGHDIWFDIGSGARLHVNGTLENGKISGAAIDERTNREYKFTATAG